MKRENKFPGHAHSGAGKVQEMPKSKYADAIRHKKAFLNNEEKSRNLREKVVNKERRKFLDMLKNAGVSGAALRASSLAAGVFSSRFATAQTTPWSNKRVVYVYLSQGSHPDRWLPDNANSMKPFSKAYGDYDVAQFMNFRQIDVKVAGHASARQSLGDIGGSPFAHTTTFDERIADVIGLTSPYSAIYVGVEATLGMSRGQPQGLMTCSSLGNPIDGPKAAFSAFFDREPPNSSDRTFEQMFSAHERVLKNLKNKLGQEEKERIDAHATALQKIQNRLDAALSADPIDVASCKPNDLNLNEDEIVRAGKIQTDILAAAMGCGLTNVATLQIGDNQSFHTVPASGYNGEVHAGAVHSGNLGFYTDVMAYHHQVPAYLIKKFSEVAGPDGRPLIESTVICVVNCMGEGNSHTPQKSPWAMATKLSGFSNSFSAFAAGDALDFHGAIPKGLGIPDSLYGAAGTDTLGLLV